MIGDCTGHGIQRCWDESLSILPQFASKLHFWIQLIESWTSFEDSEESVWQRANRLTQGLFVFLFFRFFFSSLVKNTSPPMVLSAAALTSPQVALCGCGVEDLAGVPISASLHKQTNKNMPNASRTRCKDTDKIITRTVTDITATRNCQRFFFSFLFFFGKFVTSLLRPGAPPVPSHLWNLSGSPYPAPEIQPVDKLAY